MSSFYLQKKLLPAKKAWKSFTATFQSKLHKLKLRKAIKRAKKRCVMAFNYIRPLVSRKLYSFIRHNTSSKRPPPRHHHNFPAIYIDELFPGPPASAPTTWHQSSQEKIVGSSSSGGKDKVIGESSSSSNNNGLRIGSLPHFRGVDERAENFISKFREEMQLERQQSVLDFQEMLARGV